MLISPNKTVDLCVAELYKINEWYGDGYKKMYNILQLSSARVRVVTLLTTLATYVAEAKGDAKERESQYDYTFNKVNLAYLQADNTIPMAKSKTIIDLKEEKEAMISAYKYFTNLDYFYNRMSAIAESMTQDIATLKTEQKQTQNA